MHLGPPVLDKVERSWSCWRHPNASGVGLKVAGAMETVEPHKAQSDFLEGGCGTVLFMLLFIAVYAVHAISSLDTDPPLRYLIP